MASSHFQDTKLIMGGVSELRETPHITAAICHIKTESVAGGIEAGNTFRDERGAELASLFRVK